MQLYTINNWQVKYSWSYIFNDSFSEIICNISLAFLLQELLRYIFIGVVFKWFERARNERFFLSWQLIKRPGYMKRRIETWRDKENRSEREEKLDWTGDRDIFNEVIRLVVS